jgi:predicted nucleic acid-binding protein
LTISQLNEFELEQALQLAIFRKTISPALAARAEAALQADLLSGRALRISCNLSAVLQHARRLSRAHTAKTGDRSFDILHVAAALELSAGEFLSFDAQQCQLARAEMLNVKS